MNKLILVALSALCVSPTLIAPANADGYANSSAGFRTNKSTLQKADFYNAPRQVQITDDRMILSDHRRPDVLPNVIEINAGPLAPIGGSHIVIGDPRGNGAGNSFASQFRMPSSNLTSLPQSGFGSEPNFNPNRGVSRNLPNGTSTGVHSLENVNGRLTPAQRLANANKQTGGMVAQQAPPVVAMYRQPASNQSPVSAWSASSITGDVQGRLVSRINNAHHK